MSVSGISQLIENMVIDPKQLQQSQIIERHFQNTINESFGNAVEFAVLKTSIPITKSSQISRAGKTS